MSSRVASKRSFPVVVERGPVGLKARVTIYRTPVKTDGRVYESFTVVYHLHGNRRRERFNAYRKAHSRAEEIAIKLSNGERSALELTGDDRRVYLVALEALKRIPSVTLDIAIREYVDARERLRDISLIEAVRFYEAYGRSVVKHGPLGQIRDEMVEALKAERCSAYHIRDVKRHLGKFLEHFTGEIGDITSAQINDWLRGLTTGDHPVSGRTRDNYRDSVHNFFRFARDAGYLPKGLPTAAEATKRLNEAGKDNEVYSVEEMQKMLNGAPEWLVPALALKAFSGIRTEEMVRIDWSNVKLDRDVMILPKAVTKTKQRRIVPILPNLKAWLGPYVKEEGRIAERWSSAQTLSKAWTNLAKAVGVTYKRNAMRNSYISYRTAQTKNLAQVALESGNSPQTIQENYLELVTEADAKRWFTISPLSTPQ